MPDEFAQDSAAMILVNQNSQLALRAEVAKAQDAHVAQDIDGNWVPIRRNSLSDMRQDREKPLYASEESRPRHAYLARNRSWWAKVAIPEDVPGQIAYEWWRTVQVWLAKAAPVLDKLKGLPKSPIEWTAAFNPKPTSLHKASTPIGYEEACACLSVSVDKDRGTITTAATARLQDAVFSSENIAERALVRAFIQGVINLSEQKAGNVEGLLEQIVPNTQARHSHAFLATSYRDNTRPAGRQKLINIDGYDDAQLKLGLGWQVRKRSEGAKIQGKKECQSYLNPLVSWLENSLLEDIRQFNREALLLAQLTNHEVAMVDRDR